jgi:chromosome segregation ATPase
MSDLDKEAEVERLLDRLHDMCVQHATAEDERDAEREQHALWRGRYESAKAEVERLREENAALRKELVTLNDCL